MLRQGIRIFSAKKLHGDHNFSRRHSSSIMSTVIISDAPFNSFIVVNKFRPDPHHSVRTDTTAKLALVLCIALNNKFKELFYPIPKIQLKYQLK